MTQMERRVESLETRLSPVALREVHIIGVLSGETEAGARERYPRPIAEGDEVILLVGVAPDEAA